MSTLQTIRAFMYWPKSVRLLGREGGRQKKRDRNTERARDGPKRHANYGPSFPVSLGATLGGAYLAYIKKVCVFLFFTI